MRLAEVELARTQEHRFEMSGLRSKDTGLAFYVWISPRAGARHDVRVKCSPTYRHDADNEVIVGLRPDLHVVHGEMSRSALRQLDAWVRLNFETIIGFWNEEFDDADMRERILPI